MQKQQDGNVKVVCRFRPLNKKQIELGTQVIQQVPNKSTVRIKDSKTDPLTFNLDHIFNTNSTQQQIYEVAARPVVTSVLEGFNGTIFAYGQTSSGKTHTMQGYNIEIPENKGIIPRMVEQVFSAIEKSPENIEFRLKVSIVQLYMEKVRDLLDISKQDLKIRSHAKKGIYIEDATEKYVSEVNQLYTLMSIGNQNRASCSTNMNQRSSRSHMIFLITISQTNLTDLSAKTGKLFLVDLAGSQKISKTGAQGQVLNQAKKINLSLTSLGKVIKALTESKHGAHIPYRQSKLTRILQQSLGGNSKTTLVITCSPHPINLPQTISTLRFGVSAKKVSNKAKINRQMTVGQLQGLLEKAQKQIAQKERIIKLLEKYITDDLKAKLPSYEQVVKLKQLTPKKVKQHQEIQDQQTSVAQQQDQNLLENPIQNVQQKQIINHINQQTQERIRILQAQLQSMKMTLIHETQKVSQLRLTYNILHSENLETQQKNQSLINQLEQLKQQKQRLKVQIDQLEAPKPFLLQKNQKQIAKSILKQILQSVQSEEHKNNLLTKLKNQKWFNELQNDTLDLEKFLQIQKQKMAQQIKTSQNQQSSHTIQNNANINNKLLKLQNELQNLYGQYYDVISMQSTWKAQCQIYEQIFCYSDENYSQSVKESNNYNNQLKSQKKELQNKKNKDSDTISVFQVTTNRLVKPIRGGSKLFQF